MKRIGLLLAAFIAVFLIGACNSYSSLHKETDYFVNELYSTCHSYGLHGYSSRRFSDDGKYCVTPMGRLIIVRIEHYDSLDEYEKLRNDLENYYKSDTRVNQVYINQAGTVVIDCRN